MVKLQVAIHGKARYSVQRAFASHLLTGDESGWYRGGIPSSLMWMKEFLFIGPLTIDRRPFLWSIVHGPPSTLKGGTNEKNDSN